MCVFEGNVDSKMSNSKFAKAFAIPALLLTLGFQSGAMAQDKRGEKGAAVAAQESVPEVDVPAPSAPARGANGSLFTDDAPNASLLSDFKPRRVGDLVFIDVVESSAASVSSSAKRARDSGALGGIVGAVGALPVPGAAVVGGVAGGLGARKYEGKGSTDRRSDVRARIVARVVEVLPNGDLRVEAVKSVKINKEHERLALGGIVRARDVSADNSVPTTSVGELRVELSGKGIASADNAPGWLYRLFEKITPF